MTLVPVTQRSSGGSDVVQIHGFERPPAFRGDYTWPQALLRTVQAGSAGVVVLIAGYGPYLPHVGTSTLIVDSRFLADAVRPQGAAKRTMEKASSTLRTVLALSVADQARELMAALSLNKSQFADILGVSRPTLYDWLDGNEPNAANADRLSVLLRIVSSAGITSESPLSPRFLRLALSEGATPLINHLKAVPMDEAHVSALVREAKSLGQQATSKRVEREDRLRGLGFEDPSDEQRREQLGRNVAMRDWPKT